MQKNKLLAVLLAFCMLCSMVVPTYAADETACDHEYTFVSTMREATCTKSGVGKYQCTLCEENKYEFIPATHVKPENGVIVEDATCVAAGKSTYQCAVCTETVVEPIPATGEHGFADMVTDATCTEPMRAGSICAVCGEANGEVTELGEPLGHTREDVITKDPTCKEAGTKNVVCSVCKEVLEENAEVSASGHKWGESEYKDADCVNGSLEVQTCEVCGETKEVETGLEEALGHEYKGTVTAATCQAGGYTTYTCERCGDEYTAEETEIDPEGHVYTETVLKEATCTKAGAKKLVCSLCENVIYESIPADHNWEGTVTTPATCGTDGVMTYTCTVDGCNGNKTEVIPATEEHDFVPETIIEATCLEPMKIGTCCIVCGAWDGEYEILGEPAGHTYGDVYKEDGTDYQKCNVCDYVTVVGLCNGNNHTPVAAVEENIVDATCESAGSYDSVVYCSVCEVEISRETVTVDALEHNLADDEAVDATCTEEGKEAGKHCENCDYTEGGAVISAIGHNYVENSHYDEETGELITEHICSNCGDSY